MTILADMSAPQKAELKAAIDPLGVAAGDFAPNSPANTRMAALEAGAVGGSLDPGKWVLLGGTPIIDLFGTGTVTVDTKNAAGTISAAVAVFNPPTDEDDWLIIPGAVYTRATCTGTASARIR